MIVTAIKSPNAEKEPPANASTDSSPSSKSGISPSHRIDLQDEHLRQMDMMHAIQHESDEQHCSFLSNGCSIAHQIHVVSTNAAMSLYGIMIRAMFEREAITVKQFEKQRECTMKQLEQFG